MVSALTFGSCVFMSLMRLTTCIDFVTRDDTHSSEVDCVYGAAATDDGMELFFRPC